MNAELRPEQPRLIEGNLENIFEQPMQPKVEYTLPQRVQEAWRMRRHMRRTPASGRR